MIDLDQLWSIIWSTSLKLSQVPPLYIRQWLKSVRSPPAGQRVTIRVWFGDGKLLSSMNWVLVLSHPTLSAIPVIVILYQSFGLCYKKVLLYLLKLLLRSVWKFSSISVHFVIFLVTFAHFSHLAIHFLYYFSALWYCVQCFCKFSSHTNSVDRVIPYHHLTKHAPY